MADHGHAIIDDLVAGHRARPALPLPHRRAAVWFLCTLVLSMVLALLVQAFRPGFAQQLLQHPILLMEVVSAALLAALGGYVAFIASVPGERTPRAVVILMGIVAIVFAAALALSFTSLGAPSSSLGARLACKLEVLVYGSLSLGLLLIMLRKGYLRFSGARGSMLGLAAGLLPATIMQLACLYDPSHGLSYHYAPVIVLVGLGLLLNHALRR